MVTSEFLKTGRTLQWIKLKLDGKNKKCSDSVFLVQQQKKHFRIGHLEISS